MMLVKTIGTFPSRGGKPQMTYRKIKYPNNPFRDQFVLGAAQAKYLAKHVKDLYKLLRYGATRTVRRGMHWRRMFREE